MNSGFSGADVAQLRLLSSKLKTQSGKLSEIALSSSTALLAAEWTGNDIDAIRGNWNRKSLPALRGLANSLHEMGVELDRQAMEQERASGATAGAPASSIFERFQRAVEGVMLGIVGILAPSVLPNASPEPSAAPPSTPNPAPARQPTAKPEVKPSPGFDLEQAQKEYDEGGFTSSYFAPGGGGAGQCTSWVNFRRNQLAHDGAVGEPIPIRWNNGSFYPGDVSGVPSDGAVGSYFTGKYNDDGSPINHTFIVESISSGPPKSIFISEMNNSARGGLGKVNTDVFKFDESSGLWTSQILKGPKQISFGK